MSRGRVGMTVTNAQTGEPLEVDAEVSSSSIIVRVGETIYAVHAQRLTVDQARVMADQLVRLTTAVEVGVSRELLHDAPESS